MNAYIGQEHQIRGVEQYILKDGRGDGMRILQIRNGKGLEIHISADRCADISRLSLCGVNLGYFSPCGYVSPVYYDKEHFLRSFTAGFMTTCGLTTAGAPCEDAGEPQPLHGTVSNTPAVITVCEETDEGVRVKATVRDGEIFRQKLVLTREYFISYSENTVELHDTVKNEGDTESPVMLIYHCNMGYPLLDENAEVAIPGGGYIPRNEESAKHMDDALIMEPPQAGYKERCYYHDANAKNGVAAAGIYNPVCETGAVISYEKETLDKFIEWKMMGVVDYALGLEPANCTPDGRDEARRRGELKTVAPGGLYETRLRFTLCRDKQSFTSALETPRPLK